MTGGNWFRAKLACVSRYHQWLTVAALSTIARITERRVHSNIKALKDAGIVTREGAAKNGCWIVHQELGPV